MMTLEEAIKHAEEVAKEQEELYRLCPASESEISRCDGTKDCKTLKSGKNKGCQKCAKEHRQLAKWLKDYKRLLEQESIFDKIKAEIEQLRNLKAEHYDLEVYTKEYNLRKDAEMKAYKLEKALEQEPITDRIEYGTDGNAYRLTVSNGKEFKKEPILDKIRAEIVEMRSKQNVGVLECLDIIDKYRGES